MRKRIVICKVLGSQSVATEDVRPYKPVNTSQWLEGTLTVDQVTWYNIPENSNL